MSNAGDGENIDISKLDTNLLVIQCIARCICTVIPCIFVAIGIGEASKGIANATDIKIDSVMTLMPMGFISASLIYTLIAFFLTAKINNYINMHEALRSLSTAVIAAFGSACSAYAVSQATKNAIVARAQNKKFSTYFMIMLMFGEAIGVFALIFAMTSKFL